MTEALKGYCLRGKSHKNKIDQLNYLNIYNINSETIENIGKHFFSSHFSQQNIVLCNLTRSFLMFPDKNLHRRCQR